MGLKVSRAALNSLLAEAAHAAPEECCGILLGRDGCVEAIRRTDNIAAEPLRHFEIDSQALVDAHRAARAGEAQVLGYYHSHPTGSAEPSATDAAHAPHDGRVWAIVGEGGVAFWRDGKAGFERLSYTVKDR